MNLCTEHKRVETKISLVYEHARSIIAMRSTNQTTLQNSRAAL